MDLQRLFQARLNESHDVLQKVGEKLKADLDRRSRHDRSEVEDHQLFGPASSAANQAYKAGESSLAITILNLAYDLAHGYEQRTQRQVHKGAIVFDLGLLYLGRNDFSAAMRFFEIAESETQTTRQGAPFPTFDVYHSEIFASNFWRPIGRKLEKYPMRGYQALWGRPCGESEARDDWEHLSRNSQLLYLISLARRMHYLDLANETAWCGSKSLFLAHWNLSADLARIVETELRKKAQCPPALLPTLGNFLKKCFTHTHTPENLSALIGDLDASCKVTDTESFKHTFAKLNCSIETGPTWEDKVAAVTCPPETGQAIE
jgi:hypothetical protein